MDVRTTPKAVQGVLGRNYDGATDVTPFIHTAHSWTNKVAASARASELSDDDFELIERYLAAHAYGHHDQFFTSNSVGSQDRTAAEFQGKTAMYFEASQYGQTALTLDVTGTLATMQQEAQKGGRKTASIRWLGTRSRYDYSNRAGD